MKKILIALLIAVLCFSFVACSDIIDTPDDTTADTVADTNDDGVKETEPPKETLPPAPEVDDVKIFSEDVVHNVTPDTDIDDYEWIS